MKKRKNNRKIALYIIIAVVLIGALYLISNPITGGIITEDTSATTGRELKFSRKEFPEYYSLLPPKPADFEQIKLMWERGIIRDIPERINESYWKQPEWFPLYEETFVNALESIANEGRESIWSLGVFDAQIYRKVNQEWLQNPTIPTTQGHGIVEIKNDSVIVRHRFWVRAVPGALKNFGVGLFINYPKSAVVSANAFWGINREEIEQDPEIAKGYIKAWTYEGETGKTEFTLGNYWPKLNPNYMKEIWVEAEISKNTPKGKYIVQVDLSAPSRDYQMEQNLKYGLAYTDPNIGIYRGPSKFRLFIEVI